MSEDSPKVVLTIAGFDPSSGAGITADLKTIAAHHLYGIACITALTVQNTQGVRRVQPLDASLFTQTLEALVADIRPAAVKIGMLGDGEIAGSVVDFLHTFRLPNVVLDPVLRSSSGAKLLDQTGFEVLQGRLLGMADVITPNLEEAGLLSGMQVQDLPSMKEAARKLLERGAKAVVITGGHLPEVTDMLAVKDSDAGISYQVFGGRRVETSNTHGTGCGFSTSLACNLALGRSLPEAVKAAKTNVTEALNRSYAIGKGTNPINHSFGS